MLFFRAQQVERDLAAVAEENAAHESVKSPTSIFKPRASPKPRLFSALKKDSRSRSNSSALHTRRYSTDSILGERLDSIGRRLSRDLTNSPPDLGHRFESFGKSNESNKYDTISGGTFDTKMLSKSNEILSTRYDTFSGKSTMEKADITTKSKKSSKRPKINFESYHRDNSSPEHESRDNLTPVNESLEPPIYQEDRSTAILRQQLHEELRAKYAPQPGSNGQNQSNQRATVESVSPSNQVIVRPPLPKKPAKHQHQRQKSLDNLDAQNGSSTQSKTSPRGSMDSNLLAKGGQKSHISLQRLSRDDLLRLSQSSQSEIHEYLAEPP